MRGLTANQQLLQWLEQSRANLLAAIEGLSEEQMNVPGIGGWSVKDQLTHLTLWDEMRFFEISRIARGGAPSFAETDEEGLAWLNDRFRELRGDLPVAQVLADLAFAHEMVTHAIAAAPEDRLDERLFAEIGAIGAVHEVGHAALIREWRQKEGI